MPEKKIAFFADPLWKSQKSLDAVSKLIDVRHSCGYVTLMKSSTSKKDTNKERRDVQVDNDKSKMDLIGEELDKIDLPQKKKSLSLDVGSKTSSLDEGIWSLLDLNFGIPLFDPKLNKDICERVVDEGLWKNNRLTKELSSLIYSARPTVLPITITVSLEN